MKKVEISSSAIAKAEGSTNADVSSVSQPIAKPNVSRNAGIERIFKLEESQIEKLNAWQNKIKELFGEYGLYDYMFTPTGIGIEVKVVSHITKTALDLSEVEKW